MDDYRLHIGACPFLYLAIFRYSGLWELAILWINIPSLLATYAFYESEKQK